MRELGLFRTNTTGVGDSRGSFYKGISSQRCKGRKSRKNAQVKTREALTSCHENNQALNEAVHRNCSLGLPGDFQDSSG